MKRMRHFTRTVVLTCLMSFAVSVGACFQYPDFWEDEIVMGAAFLNGGAPGTPPTSGSNTYSIGALSTTVAARGSTYSFDITVTGNASETLTIYLSRDPAIDQFTDTNMGTVSISREGTATASFSIPPGADTGEFYVGVVQITGTSTVSTNTLTVGNAYSIGNFSAASVARNSPFTFDVTAAGAGETESLTMRISSDQTINSWDESLGTLNISGTGVVTADVVSPVAAPGGRYYIGLQNTNGDVVAVSADPIIIGNLYTIGALASTSASPGSSYSFTLTVEGVGEAETLTVHMDSATSMYGYSSNQIGSVNVTAAGTITVNVTIPAQFNPGDFYIGVVNSLGSPALDVSTNTLALTLNTGGAIALTASAIADPWTGGSITDGNDEVLYSFNTAANTVYAIVWDDSIGGSGSYTEDVVVSVFAPDARTIVYRPPSNGYFNRVDSGYFSPSYLFSPTASTFYIRVSCFSTSCTGGTFGIKAINVTSTISAGSATDPYTVHTLQALTPSNVIKYHFYRLNVASGLTYTVRFEDLFDQSAAVYNQDVFVGASTLVVDGLPTEHFYSVSEGFTTSPSFTASADGTVFIYVYTLSAETAPGYAIKVY